MGMDEKDKGKKRPSFSDKIIVPGLIVILLIGIGITVAGYFIFNLKYYELVKSQLKSVASSTAVLYDEDNFDNIKKLGLMAGCEIAIFHNEDRFMSTLDAVESLRSDAFNNIKESKGCFYQSVSVGNDVYCVYYVPIRSEGDTLLSVGAGVPISKVREQIFSSLYMLALAAGAMMLLGLFILWPVGVSLGRKMKSNQKSADLSLEKSMYRNRQLVENGENSMQALRKVEVKIGTGLTKNGELADAVDYLKGELYECMDRQQMFADHISNQAMFMKDRLAYIEQQLAEVMNRQAQIGNTEKKLHYNIDLGLKASEREVENTERMIAGFEAMKKTLSEMQTYSNVIQAAAKEADLQVLGIGIEASRFGDPGRKLSEMVGAVGKLIEQNGRSAEEIENFIVALNADASALSDMAGLVGKDIKTNIANLTDNGAELEQSSEILKELRDRCGEISKNTGSVSEGTMDVNRIATDFVKSAAEYEEYVNQLVPLAAISREIADDLGSVVEELDKIVDGLKEEEE